MFQIMHDMIYMLHLNKSKNVLKSARIQKKRIYRALKNENFERYY